MNKIVKIAIVMAIMMSATFAFGQGTTGVSNPTGGTSVTMIIDNPHYDVWTYDITYRWKDGSGNWGDWHPVTENASGGLQTEAYFWTSWDATKFEYQIAAKKQDGTPIAGSVGIFTINNHGGTLYIHGWLRANP